MKLSKQTISTILRFATFVFALWGVLEAARGEFMARNTFLYYTTQSNIAVGLVCLAFGVLDVVSHFGNQIRIPRWLNVVKYAVTVAITLTFIVFWFMLAPIQMKDYPELITDLDSILCHGVVPILAVCDWLVNVQCYRHKKSDLFWSISTPLAYFVFVMIASLCGVEFGYGAKVPYFFLDFYQYGWFNLNSFPMGVFWWILIVLGIVLGIGALLLKVKDAFGRVRQR